MSVDTTLQNVIINVLNKQQYRELVKDPNQFYLVTDAGGLSVEQISSTDFSNLSTKDSGTLYVVTPDAENAIYVDFYILSNPEFFPLGTPSIISVGDAWDISDLLNDPPILYLRYLGVWTVSTNLFSGLQMSVDTFGWSLSGNSLTYYGMNQGTQVFSIVFILSDGIPVSASFNTQ